MIDIDVRKDVPAPADAVWHELRSFEGIENWLPMIEHSEVRGHGVGATRECTVAGGGRILERLQEVDDDERRLVYTIFEAPMPIWDHSSTMRVLPDGPDASTVVWSASFDAPGDAAEEIEATLRGAYASGLDGLRASFGGA